MSVRWYTVVVDCVDPHAQARWWGEVLGWNIVFENDEEVVLVGPRGEPGLVFVPVPEGKQVKNRLHLDLAPWATDDQAAEVARLERLGARRVDVGQGDRPWVVLADPEGNEFCVLTPRDTPGASPASS